MRAGGKPRNPYHDIERALNRSVHKTHRASLDRLTGPKSKKKHVGQFQSQEIDDTSTTQSNLLLSSSRQLARDNGPKNVKIVEADTMKTASNGLDTNVGVCDKGAWHSSLNVVSSTQKGQTAGKEGYNTSEDEKLNTCGSQNQQAVFSERARPLGWSVKNTKAERIELSQSDEEEMLRLSEGVAAREGVPIDQTFRSATSDVDRTPPKRQKRQKGKTLKRPRASCLNRSSRDILELLPPQSEASEEKYSTPQRSEERSEVHDTNARAFRASNAKIRPLCLEPDRDAKRVRSSDTSLEEDELMEDQEPLIRDAQEELSSCEPLKNVAFTVQCMSPSAYKQDSSQCKQERRVGGGISRYPSHSQASFSDNPIPPGRIHEIPIHDASSGRNDAFRENASRKKVKRRNPKKERNNEIDTVGTPRNMEASVGDDRFHKELRTTSGDQAHTDGSPESGEKSHSRKAHDSGSDGSSAGESVLPSGENGFSMSKKTFDIGLHVRQQLLNYSKSNQEEPFFSAEVCESLACQDESGTVAARSQEEHLPDHEDSGEVVPSNTQNATNGASLIELDVEKKREVASASQVEEPLVSPSKYKRRRRRNNKKAVLMGRNEPDKRHATVIREGSAQSRKHDKNESPAHDSLALPQTKPGSPNHVVSNCGKKSRKKVRDTRSDKSPRRTDEGIKTAVSMNHTQGLDDKADGNGRHKTAKGTKTELAKDRNSEGNHWKNDKDRSSSWKQQPQTEEPSEKDGSWSGDESSSELMIVESRQASLDDEGNNKPEVFSIISEKTMTSQRQDHTLARLQSKTDSDEIILDVDTYAERQKEATEMQIERKLKEENLDHLVDPKKREKQSELLRRSTRLRQSRSHGKRCERSRTAALDELSDDEDAKSKETKVTASFSRSRGRSGTQQAVGGESGNTHPMTTRRRATRSSMRAVTVIDLTNTGDTDDTVFTARTAGGGDDIAESLRELQELSLQDKEKAISERPRCKYLTPLSDEENKLATDLFRRTKLDTRIVAISEAGITLRGESFKRLRGTRWLDDEVLNAYVSLINSRNDAVFKEMTEEHRSGIPRTYVFNTYFFTRLCSGSSGFDYPGVQGWTKRAKVDLLEKDIILIPINLGNHHWVLSGIDLEHQEILYLDSMHGPDSAKAISKLKRWVYEELRHKHGESTALKYDPSSWKEIKHSYRVRRIGVLPEELEPREGEAGRVAKVPVQQDGGSCGVFTAKMADCLSLGIKVYFKQSDIPLIRRRMALDLFRGYVPL